jgi:hypothetical protein
MGLPREPGPLRLLGVATPADAEKRGLTMLTGRVGLVIGKMMAENEGVDTLLSHADVGGRVRGVTSEALKPTRFVPLDS